MSAVKIRDIEISELNQLLDLIDKFDRVKAERPTEAQLQAAYSNLKGAQGSIIGAFHNNKLVGTCMLNICANFSWTCRPYAMIENVIVSENYRNKGIGKKLLTKAKNRAQALGCYKVALITGSKRIETHQFYVAAGFEASKVGFQIRFDA